MVASSPEEVQGFGETIIFPPDVAAGITRTFSHGIGAIIDGEGIVGHNSCYGVPNDRVQSHWGSDNITVPAV